MNEALTLNTFRADSGSFHVASTLVLGEREALLIDAQFTRAAAHRLVADIVDSGRRLAGIYVSHGDPDYYFGLEVVCAAFPGVPVWTAEPTHRHISATGDAKIALWGPQLGANAPTRVVVPEVLAQPWLELEGRRLEIVGLDGPMPTHSVVWIPSLRAVVGGVLVYSDVHGFMADVQRPEQRRAWLAALDRVEALSPRVVVPTHAQPGSACDLRALQFTRDYIVAFDEELPKAGDAAELIAAMKRRFPDATLDIALEIGAKVLKGEMRW